MFHLSKTSDTDVILSRALPRYFKNLLAHRLTHFNITFTSSKKTVKNKHF